MKLNIKSVCAIVALTVAASAAHANGLIGPGASTGSDIILNIWDQTSLGYTQDLGIQVANFDPTHSFSMTLNSAAVTAFNAADDSATWDIVGAQASSKTYLTTSMSPTSTSNSSSIGLAISNTTTLYGVVASSPGQTFSTSTTGFASGLSSTSNGGAGWSGSFDAGAGNLSDTTSNFTDANSDGTGTPPSQLDFLKLVSGGSNTAYQGFWTLTFNGMVGSATSAVLSWTSTASAVPLPAAVWLLGSGLLGLAGIGRRRGANLAAA